MVLLDGAAQLFDKPVELGPPFRVDNDGQRSTAVDQFDELRGLIPQWPVPATAIATATSQILSVHSGPIMGF